MAKKRARIDRKKLAAYAKRRGLSVSTQRRWAREGAPKSLVQKWKQHGIPKSLLAEVKRAIKRLPSKPKKSPAKPKKQSSQKAIDAFIFKTLVRNHLEPQVRAQYIRDLSPEARKEWKRREKAKPKPEKPKFEKPKPEKIVGAFERGVAFAEERERLRRELSREPSTQEIDDAVAKRKSKRKKKAQTFEEAIEQARKRGVLDHERLRKIAQQYRMSEHAVYNVFFGYPADAGENQPSS